jgi:hypothetical protein
MLASAIIVVSRAPRFSFQRKRGKQTPGPSRGTFRSTTILDSQYLSASHGVEAKEIIWSVLEPP